MTDISIGGLLSEASLLGRFNNCHSKSTGITGGLQASQLITDSLDAFIAAHIDRSQGPNPPNNGSTSSIFYAEDARYAFPVQKSSAASREARGLSESVHLQTCCQEAGSKSIKDQNSTELIGMVRHGLLVRDEIPKHNSLVVVQLCCICLSNTKNMAFGCGHQTCCECGESLQSCPICRSPIQTRIKLY